MYKRQVVLVTTLLQVVQALIVFMVDQQILILLELVTIQLLLVAVPILYTVVMVTTLLQVVQLLKAYTVS